MDWKQVYNQYMLTDQIDLNKVKILKDTNMPNVFFKYRYFDENGFWKDWVSGTVYTSKPKEFNDPYDCLLKMRSEICNSQFAKNSYLDFLKNEIQLHLSEEDINIIKSSYEPLVATVKVLEKHGIIVDRTSLNNTLNYSLMELEKTLREELRITCFSEKNNSMLLWSHYSNSHKGFCIEYDFRKDEYIKKFLFPVVYTATYKQPDLRSDGWLLQSALYKSTEWEYENEWRFVNVDVLKYESGISNDYRYTFSAKKNIRAIYIGAECDCNSENVKLLCELAKPLLIPIYRMKMLPNEFALNYERYI